MTSLDLSDPQVLIKYDDDPVGWHRRLLLCNVGGAVWIASTPNYDVEQVDLNEFVLIALGRREPVPLRAHGDVYTFDQEIDPVDIARLRREAAFMAEALGAPAPTREESAAAI